MIELMDNSKETLLSEVCPQLGCAHLIDGLYENLQQQPPAFAESRLLTLRLLEKIINYQFKTS